MRRARRFGWIATLSLAIAGFGVTLALAADDGGVTTNDYEVQRAAAEKQAAMPGVAAYREQIVPLVDSAMGEAFLHCVRRELYSRRAAPTAVLTIDGDGSVIGVSSKIVNRMGRCGVNTLTGLRLPPPPVAPLQVEVEVSARGQ